MWHYSLKHGLSGRHLYITPLCESQSPHGRHEARCHLAFHSGEIEIQNKPDRDFGSSALDGELQCLHHHFLIFFITKPLLVFLALKHRWMLWFLLSNLFFLERLRFKTILTETSDPPLWMGNYIVSIISPIFIIKPFSHLLALLDIGPPHFLPAIFKCVHLIDYSPLQCESTPAFLPNFN